jgi:CHASE3 domain sensor protein
MIIHNHTILRDLANIETDLINLETGQRDLLLQEKPNIYNHTLKV